MPGFLNSGVVDELRALCMAHYRQGSFHRAGVGARQPRISESLRGDAILWLEDDDTNPSVRDYAVAMESLRQAANRQLFLGLDHLESHFAVYPAGGFYKKHLDRFRDDDRRTLTAIVYLNEVWTPEDGGVLRIWPSPSGDGETIDIVPQGGTLVTFLSERFWHEVLPAHRPRAAITGWFKRR